MTLHKHNSKKENTQTLLHKINNKKITGINNHWSLISLNINGLNSPIKRHRLRDWIQKQDPHSAVYKKHTSTTKTDTYSE